MPKVTCSNLSHAYSNQDLVIENVSFTLDNGKSMVVTGPSGSGKSTLLNILALLIKPTKGKIMFDEMQMNPLKNYECSSFRLKHIGLVRQDLALLPDRNVLENVIVPLLLQGGIGKKEILERGKDVLEKVGLSNQIHSKTGQISGGQRQRLAIARALITHPSIILADEPTAQLDEKNTHIVTELLLRRTEGESNLIFATHDLSLVGLFDEKLYLRSM